MNDVVIAPPPSGASCSSLFRRGRLLVLCALGVPLVATVSKAATEYHWESATNGSWNDAAKWTPGGYPGSGMAQDDSAYIDASGGPYTVTHDLVTANINSHFADRLEISAPSATLHVKGGTASRSPFTMQRLHIGAGRVEFSGRTWLTADNITLMDGTLIANGQLSVSANTITQDGGEIRIGTGGSFDLRATKQLGPYDGNFTLAADGRLHLDGPLRVNGDFRNNGGRITGDGGVHIENGTLIQGGSNVSGSFFLRGDSYLFGADPSLDRVFEGQTVVIQGSEYGLRVRDAFRNAGTIIMEPGIGGSSAILSAYRMGPSGAEMGTVFNEGDFDVRVGSSPGNLRMVHSPFVNDSTGSVAIQAPTTFAFGLTNSGMIRAAPGVDVTVGSATFGILVQKAGILDIPGTITLRSSSTFVNEGGIISGNPTVRFPHFGTVINDTAEDNGSVTFVLEYGTGHIRRSASGKVLLGKGQTFTNLHEARSLDVEPGFVNHGKLLLAHSMGIGILTDGLPSTTEPVTNAGVIEFSSGSSSGSSARIVNLSTGVVRVAGTRNTLAEIDNAGSFVVAPSAQATLGDLSNSGRIEVSGTANVGGTFANTGTVTVSWGLRLNGSSSNDGVLEAKDGGAIYLFGGTAEKPFINRGTLSLPSGKLELHGQDLINPVADAGEKASALAMLNDLVRSARNGPSGLWSGPGIVSSRVTSGSHRTLAVGATEDAVIVRLTYNGDANLDGRINADDYFRIDQGFLAQPSDPLFSQGDFNYDGKINADDYFLIDQAFLGQGAPLVSASAGALAAAAAAVPEPGVSLVAIVVAGSLLRRRRGG